MSGHENGTMVTFTVSSNTSSLLSKNAWCTVTLRTRGNISSLINKQLVSD
jgi:hypothetical protein